MATGAVASATHDIFDDLNAALMLLESDGYEPDAWLLRQTMRGVLRNARDGTRGFLYPAGGPSNSGAQNGRWAGEVWNIPAKVSKMGLSGFAAGAANALAFAFDTSHVQDRHPRRHQHADVRPGGHLGRGRRGASSTSCSRTSKVLRVTFRLAWVAANPVTLQAPSRAASYPASVLTQGTFVGALGVEAAAASAGDRDRALTGQNQPSLTGAGRTAEDEAGTRAARQTATRNGGELGPWRLLRGGR